VSTAHGFVPILYQFSLAFVSRLSAPDISS